jgi:hypothetical protein
MVNAIKEFTKRSNSCRVHPDEYRDLYYRDAEAGPSPPANKKPGRAFLKASEQIQPGRMLCAAPAQPHSILTHVQPILTRVPPPGHAEPKMARIPRPSNPLFHSSVAGRQALVELEARATEQAKVAGRKRGLIQDDVRGFKPIRRIYECAMPLEVLENQDNPAVFVSDDGEVIGADPATIDIDALRKLGVTPEKAPHGAIVANCRVCACASKYRAAPAKKVIKKLVESCHFTKCPAFWLREPANGYEVDENEAKDAITKYCVNCRDGNEFAIYTCAVVACPLWPHRPVDPNAILYALRRTNPAYDLLFDRKARLTPLLGPDIREKHENTGLTQELIRRGSSFLTPRGSKLVAGTLPSELTRAQAISNRLIRAPFEDYARNMCLSCKDDSMWDVAHCTKTSCPIYDWRFRVDLSQRDAARARISTEEPSLKTELEHTLAKGDFPPPVPIGEAIRNFCLDCRDGSAKDVADCVVVSCPLWLVREAPLYFWDVIDKKPRSRLLSPRNTALMEFEVMVEAAKAEIRALISEGKKVPLIPEKCMKPVKPGPGAARQRRKLLMARRAWRAALDEMSVVPAGKAGTRAERYDP